MFLSYLFIFFLGCFLGWIIEFIYRSITNKRIYNPGFLNGPYLPIYGFGILTLYIISSFNISIYYKIILYFIILTLLEYITGIIFIKLFKIKLWDYSDMELNFRGIICLRFSIYWTIFATFFYLFLYKLIYSLSIIVANNDLISILLFFLLFVFVIDLIVSFKLMYKLKILRKDLKLKIVNFNYINFRNKIRRYIAHNYFNKYFLLNHKIKKKRILIEIKRLIKKHNN